MTRAGQKRWLLLGDILAILVVTMIGFLNHYGAITGWRWLSTFVPVLVSWLALAPWLGVYRAEVYCRAGQVWRSGLAALLAAPLAATLRAFWLSEAVIVPVFVVVLGLTNMLGFLLWRLAWAFFAARAGRRQVEEHG
jgi:Protein of unknown function (DUF3054)